VRVYWLLIVAGHFGGDLVYLIQGFGEEGQAASSPESNLQGAAGVANFASGHFVAEEKADGVDHRP